MRTGNHTPTVHPAIPAKANAIDVLAPDMMYSGALQIAARNSAQPDDDAILMSVGP